ncbi:MAG: hypothetical protein GY799_31575, partial [Desulfobulbaceae bacterium]|nr:hypothetical protein [Desulfobulbaceae bacterium]
MNKETVAFQPELVESLPQVLNNKEFAEYQYLLERIDEIINVTGMDLEFACEHLQTIEQQRLDGGIDRPLSGKQVQLLTRYAVKAYRCTIAGILLRKPYRELSIILADSATLRQFCTISRIDNQIRVPSKSSLQRFANLFDEDFLRSQVDSLVSNAAAKGNPLGLRNPFNVEDIFVDATCMKANIHFPVDWVLMSDCMLTMLQAIIVIRKHGLKHRISDPKGLISRINAISMSITSASRNRKEKKGRKKCFRKLKKMAKVIREHGCRYADLLRAERAEKTDLTEAEAAYILERIDRMIRLLPEACEQANSRILSEELVKNKEKLLSAYHDDVNVIKRGKAGGQVEFGNTLFLAEQADGVIVDWKLGRTDVKEPQATKDTIKRLTDELEYDIKSMTGDRGCQSASLDKQLDKKGIFNGLCPRS